MSIELDLQLNGIEQFLGGVTRLEVMVQTNAGEEYVKLAKKIVAEIKAHYVPVDVGMEGLGTIGKPHSTIRKTPKLRSGKRRVEGGTLRESVECDEVARLNSDGGIEVSIWAGREGSGAEDYAWIQHENLTYKHAIGQAKYIEIPIAMIATTEMAQALISAIRNVMDDDAWG